MFLLALSGCSMSENKYELSYYQYFDTLIDISYEAADVDLADNAKAEIERVLPQMHKLFDRYKSYDGVVNVNTINSNPTQMYIVEPDLLALIKYGKEAYELSGGAVNIASGALLDVWHMYRTQALENKDKAALPSERELSVAADNMSIDGVIVGEDGKVGVIDGVSIDLGALAKGYVADVLMDSLTGIGVQDIVINLGGNVAVGSPTGGKKSFNVGVQDPKSGGVYEVVEMREQSLVTSGDYQRFFEVDGKRYNHIIDPKTHMPSTNFSAVSIKHDSSLVADMLSTAVFILDYESGKALVENMSAEALWIFNDGQHKNTDNFFN